MKHFKRWIIFLLVLFSVYFIFKYFLKACVGNWIAVHVNLNKLDTKDILSIISGIISIIFAFLSNYYFKRREEKITLLQEVPYLNICGVRKQSITGKRKQKNHNSFEVELGKPEKEFRYVYAKIINTGKSTAVKCSIAKKCIPCQLPPQAEYPVSFLIYESPKQKIKRNYTFKYQMEDGKGSKYIGVYILKINTHKREAEFYLKKGQKEV